MLITSVGAPIGPCLEDSLGEMLSESVESVRRREQTTFDELAAPYEQRLVLFGAGLFGRRTLRGLRRIGIEPLAFADNNSALWGKRVDGLKVLSAADAAECFGRTAAFILTIWNGNLRDTTGDRIRKLNDLGCDRVIPVGFLFWKYPDVFLPFYPLDLPHKVLPHANEIMAAYRLWDDEASRREYVTQIAFRLFLDFDQLSAPSGEYFPADVFRLNAGEVLIDCGAYDGDTIRSFVRRHTDKFAQILAYEPDDANWEKLLKTVSAYPEAIQRKITCFKQAVGAKSGVISFDSTGTELSTVGSGTMTVPATTLDESLRDVAPTLIKFDIEGAELDALAGARATVKRHHPALAVSAYHQQGHLWEVPLAIAAMNDEYQFLLRPHSAEGWDLVCYAAPAGRVVLTEEA